MRYWLYDEKTKKAVGPHLALVLKRLPGFGPESRVAPEGTKEWKRAKEIDEIRTFLDLPPEPPAAPAGETKAP